MRALRGSSTLCVLRLRSGTGSERRPALLAGRSTGPIGRRTTASTANTPLNGGGRALSEYLQTVFDKFELRVHKEYHYTEDGLWAKIEDGRVRVGASDYLQRTGGDVAFVEVIRQGSIVERQAEFGTVETAKTTVSLLSPISGTIEQINDMLSEKPELVNSDPYREGWLVILAPRNLEDDLKMLMSADQYFELMLRKLETEQRKLEVR